MNAATSPEIRVDAAEFRARLTAMLVRSAITHIPRRRKDRQILLRGIVLGLDKKSSWREKELNASLQTAIRALWRGHGPDHVTVRRMLVDEGYLVRSVDGSNYRLTGDGPGDYAFAAEIDAIDVRELIDDALGGPH